MKKIVFSLLALVVAMVLAGCSGNPVKSGVSSIQSSLPAKFADWGSITAMECPGEELDITITIADQVIFDNAKQQAEPLSKALYATLFGQKGMLSQLQPAIKDADMPVKFIFANGDSKAEGAPIKPADMPSVGGAPDPQVALQTVVALDNISMPLDVNDFMTLQLMTISDGKLTMPTTVKASAYDKKLNEKTLKAFITKQWNDETGQLYNLIKLAADANTSVTWIYQQEGTSDSKQVTYTPEELKAL